MNKWKSETLDIESKEQLKSHRKDKWRGLLIQNGLDLELYPWWTQEEKDLERALWLEADKDYEERKLILKSQVDKLSVKNTDVYFQEIGIEKQDTNVWLKPSLEKVML